jgi:hypothetical protein
MWRLNLFLQYWKTVEVNVGFEVLTVVTMKSIIYWNMMVCIYIYIYILNYMGSKLVKNYRRMRNKS